MSGSYYVDSSNRGNVNELLDQAELYRDQALQYSNDAAASAISADTSEANAQSSATNAAASASAASASQANSASSASAASASEANAFTFANSASSFATDAGVARDAAVVAKNDALAAATNAAGSSLLSANGWQKLPSGLIIQWGFSATTTTSVTVTFPIAFPNTVLRLLENDYGTVSDKAIWSASSITNTGLTANNLGSLTSGSGTFNAPSTSSYPWLAIGY